MEAGTPKVFMEKCTPLNSGIPPLMVTFGVHEKYVSVMSINFNIMSLH